MKLSEKIIELRKANGMTQEEFEKLQQYDVVYLCGGNNWGIES